MRWTLDGIGLETAGDDWWVAPTAVVIGKVRLEAGCVGLVGCRAARRQRADHHRPRQQHPGWLHLPYRPGPPLDRRPEVTVGHLAVLHGCAIGEGTLIGIGATILNGAVIGRNCLIGAKALIAEGKHIPTTRW